jgi:hypothetical protein
MTRRLQCLREENPNAKIHRSGIEKRRSVHRKPQQIINNYYNVPYPWTITDNNYYGYQPLPIQEPTINNATVVYHPPVVQKPIEQQSIIPNEETNNSSSDDYYSEEECLIADDEQQRGLRGTTFHFPRYFNKALQIGINYEGTKNELHGCIEDVDQVTEKFEQWGVRFGKSKIMTDHTNTKPTKDNIISAIEWLIAGAKPGDVLFFQYSGHGSQENASKDSYETDGKNETLCPIDMDTSGMISDDTINKLLSKAPAGCKIFMLTDCCHSGTCCDLPFTLNVNKELPKPQQPMQPYKPQQPMQPQYQPYKPQQPMQPQYQPYKPQQPMQPQYQPYKPQQPTPYPSYSYRSNSKDDRFVSPATVGLVVKVFTTIAGMVYRRFFTGKKSILGREMAIPTGTLLPPSVTQVRPVNAKARIICLSGCNDHQTSQEFDGHGAMTTAFLSILDKLMRAGATIKMTNLLQELYSELSHQGTPQLPQITSSFELTIDDAISFAL